jgi:hypothetical protein
MCSSLRKLNLKDNIIEDDDSLFYLSGLNLVYLNLAGNPLAKRENYKELVNMNLPGLKAFDIDAYEDDNEVLVEKMLSTSSTVNYSYSMIRPESSLTAKSTEKKDFISSNGFNSDLMRSSDSLSGLRPVKRGELLTPPYKKEEEFEFNKSIDLSKKSLKPVVVKKTIDADNILLHTRRNDEHEIVQEVTNNIEKINRSRANILQKHMGEDSGYAKTYRGSSQNKVNIGFIFRCLRLIK